jgi:hypothetical protein
VEVLIFFLGNLSSILLVSSFLFEAVKNLDFFFIFGFSISCSLSFSTDVAKLELL